MKFGLSSSGCNPRPAKGEPTQPVASLSTVAVTRPAMRRCASAWAVGNAATKTISFRVPRGLLTSNATAVSPQQGEGERPFVPSTKASFNRLAISARPTSDKWRERRQFVLKTARVYDRLDELIKGAKANEVSLAVFKPTKFTGFIHEEETREWDEKKLEEMRAHTQQFELFSDNSWRQTFAVIPKLPYSFSYRFEDAAGVSSEMQVRLIALVNDDKSIARLFAKPPRNRGELTEAPVRTPARGPPYWKSRVPRRMGHPDAA